jgi:hypothetical protein
VPISSSETRAPAYGSSRGNELRGRRAGFDAIEPAPDINVRAVQIAAMLAADRLDP